MQTCSGQERQTHPWPSTSSLPLSPTTTTKKSLGNIWREEILFCIDILNRDVQFQLRKKTKRKPSSSIFQAQGSSRSCKSVSKCRFPDSVNPRDRYLHRALRLAGVKMKQDLLWLHHGLIKDGHLRTQGKEGTIRKRCSCIQRGQRLSAARLSSCHHRWCWGRHMQPCYNCTEAGSKLL